ncbi:hypothetical protein KVR01_010915 [Diaporthe batatas]|uniref:uncharacterized protein n=1 Tax=Diaporthe batatas TaxID=748121 RepID=UPI001D051CE1|nr:uncharacterized protein KVR01_010915 [Diaporthe batatas]KAG8159254.1 hypothetical protein KVR01_010915 [Diaporthe batatas]
MSVTTIDNPVTTAVSRAILQDYDIHLTGDDTVTPPNQDSRPPQPASTAANPPGWDTQHRGVPPYRPINRELDLAQRPLGGNPVGDVFITTMFTGVFINASLRWLWANTGGRVNDKIFHYKVGGEI